MTTKVEPLTVTPERFEETWQKLSQMPQLFDDLEQPSPEWWARRLTRRDSVFYAILDGNRDVGVVYYTDVIPGLSAIGHIIFWDKKAGALKGREEVALQVTRQVMEEFNLIRVTAIVPEWNKAAQRFAEKIGMTLEGIVRKAVVSRGVHHDLHLYGLLRGELDGRSGPDSIRGREQRVDLKAGIGSRARPESPAGQGSVLEVS